MKMTLEKMVPETTERVNSYRRAFDEINAAGEGGSPGWLDRLKENAIDRFEELGFPSVKDEEWKYTNVAAMARTNFRPAQPTDGTNQRPPIAAADANESRLVFVNGILRDDLSTDLTAGVTVLGLLEASEDEKYGETVKRYLARGADHIANGFVALNTAFLSAGVFIHIPRELAVSRPLHLLFLSDATGDIAVFPRVLIVAEQNSNLTLIESYESPKEDVYLTNAVVEIFLGEGASIEHYKLQRESKEAFHIATTTADLGRNSRYDATTITLGAKLSRHDISVIMDNEGAECHVDGLYLVSGEQHTDTHSVIDHRKAHNTSRQLYKGIMDGKSRAVFNGKIFVRHDAQKTDAVQTNKNLLLSNEARVDTKPQLEILADDVKCAHGAAVGQLSEDELFYLETRGIHPDLSRNLLTYGFAEEVIGKIKIDSIRDQLDEVVLNRLHARLEA